MNVVITINDYRAEVCARKINGNMIIPNDDQIVLDAMRKDGEEKREDIIKDIIEYLARNYNIKVSYEVASEIFKNGVRINIKNNKIAKGSKPGYYKVI